MLMETVGNVGGEVRYWRGTKRWVGGLGPVLPFLGFFRAIKGV